MINLQKSFLNNNIIAEGGEGFVYEKDNKIIKIYKDAVNLQEKQKKLELLLRKKLPNNVIKPLDLVNIDGKFAGFIMDKVIGDEVRYLSNKKYIKANKVTFKDILKVLIQIKNTLTELHKQNIFISDLNDTNILFDSSYNVYFIDVDSWAVDNILCDVAMDSFKDPKLHLNNFTADTDAYSFAIMVWKSLTKIHPYGGTTDPDMDLLDRMKKRISVIDHPEVTIPKTIPKWNFVPPKLLNEMKSIFETSKRILLDSSLDDFANQLRLCDKDHEYYFGKFSECPFCNNQAKIITLPEKVTTVAGAMTTAIYLTNDDIDFVLSLDSYITDSGEICHTTTKKKINRVHGFKYYFSDNGEIVFISEPDVLTVFAFNKHYKFDKLLKSDICVYDNLCYFLTPASDLIELSVTPRGNATKKITKCSINTLFECISSTEYFICNMYDNIKIFNISGYNYTDKDSSKVINYGIHFDTATKHWLIILEYTNGKFRTIIFDKNKIIYESDQIRYSGALNNIVINNDIIFVPKDGSIRGFSFKKNQYKDFDCSIVNTDSKLIRKGNKFYILNDKEIYTFG